MINDYHGKAVLVTGGTKGIGLETAIAFARLGAKCFITYRWGSVEEEQLQARFRAERLAEQPCLLEADAGSEADTQKVLREIFNHCEHIEVLVSNVAFAQLVRGLEDFQKRALMRSLDYTAWPLVDYTLQTKEIFGRYPRYIVAVSSEGGKVFYKNYDFAGASKAVLETLMKYLSHRLRMEDVRMNIVRPRFVRTESLRATLGDAFEPFVDGLGLDHQFVDAEEVAKVILALCSGLMDAVKGQILAVDHGASFADGVMRLYDEQVQPTYNV